MHGESLLREHAFICLHDGETKHQKWTIAPFLDTDKEILRFDGKYIEKGCPTPRIAIVTHGRPFLEPVLRPFLFERLRASVLE